MSRRRHKIKTREGRRTLKPDPKPVYLQLFKGLAIGYRKNVKGGVWVKRERIGTCDGLHRIGFGAPHPEGISVKEVPVVVGEIFGRALAVRSSVSCMGRHGSAPWMLGQHPLHGRHQAPEPMGGK